MADRSRPWLLAVVTALLVTTVVMLALLPVLGPAFFTLGLAVLAGLIAAVAVLRRTNGAREGSVLPEHRTPSPR